MKPHGRMRSALRLAVWNVGFLLAGLILIAAAGEAWLRLTKPFMRNNIAMGRFVPGVGLLHEPNAEARRTNFRDFWTASRANRWGFLDRDPPSPGRAAASCHVSVIGDSFVHAMQVPIADKLHVRLEALAARSLPALDVTTSAFGVRATGQVAQLPLYDVFARRLRPKLLALVFHPNDFWDNSPVLTALRLGLDPDRLSRASVARGEDGALTLRPPDPEYWSHLLPLKTRSAPVTLFDEIVRRATWRSWFAKWLVFRPGRRSDRIRWRSHVAGKALELLSRRPGYEWLAGEQPAMIANAPEALEKETLSPAYEQAVAYTGFALEQFKARAERDGAELVILATYRMGKPGARLFDRLHDLAEARGIPVISQRAWIERQDGDVRDAHWPHDDHWSPIGHQWAAEALLEHLEQNQNICRGPLPSPARKSHFQYRNEPEGGR